MLVHALAVGTLARGARAFLLALALLAVAPPAMAEPRNFSWTPSDGSVGHRLYRASGMGAWRLAAESPTPTFVVEVGTGPTPLSASHTHWMAVDVMADGREVPRQNFGWWTRP